jgi:hypothetical protein
MVAQQQVRGKAKGRCCCITHVDTQLSSPASQVYHSLASQVLLYHPRELFQQLGSYVYVGTCLGNSLYFMMLDWPACRRGRGRRRHAPLWPPP